MIRRRWAAINSAVNEQPGANEDRKGIRQTVERLDRVDVGLARSGRPPFCLAWWFAWAFTV